MKANQTDSVFSWVIAICVALINIIMSGIIHNYGLIFVPLLNVFGEGESITSIPGGLIITMAYLTGKT